MWVAKTKKKLAEHLSKRDKDATLGLVPTMGALHQGHASLLQKAVSENGHVVVSIFVNPTQFNNKEDLEKYPKTLEEDLALIGHISPDIMVFAPSITDIYAQNVVHKTYDFNGLDKVMEGAFREDHFNGVGTIVETLLALVAPDRAYFGEKDFQQLRIIQKLVENQDIPVEIIGCPIVREPNGLAMSSRNERLSPQLRQKAGFIYDTLQTAKTIFGTKNAKETKDWIKAAFQHQNDFELEYVEIADEETLTPAQRKIKDSKYRAFIAVYAGGVRLIDNLALN
jgi:pantoate--beta-alanine ligase